jgi:hypothetical protein
LISVLLFANGALFSQPSSFECGMGGGSSGYIVNSGFDNLDFFQPETCGKPLYINCRFVFFTRNDGTGTFQEGEPFTDEILSEIVEGANAKWASVPDNTGCSTSSGQDYPVDSKFRMNVAYDYIDDEIAWDYYARATALGGSYFKTAFCPNSLMRANSTWPHLRDVINNYNAQYPNSFNFFFIEDGNLIREVEDHLANGTQPNGPYEGVDAFSGCSRLPEPYYSNQDQFVVMMNFYSSWFARINFGTDYFPEEASEGNELIANWHISETIDAIVHELGHSVVERSIVHETFGCASNLMSTSRPLSHLVPEQLSRLHRNMMTSNNHRYISCDDIAESTCDLVISQDDVFDEPMSIYGDLIIEEGVTLTLKSDMYLSETSSIDVLKGAKLIIDGAYLTNGCGDHWKGIRVVGGNSDFDVSIKNQAIIENTSQAAVSMFPPLPWSEARQHGNGILHAENSAFNNTMRIVEFIAFQSAANGSYIRDCVQNGGNWSVTNWNCQFIEITDNVFNDITTDCIVTESGSFLIEGNEFHSGQHDILFANVSAGIGSVIRDNLFYGSETGVKALGTTFDENIILNNNFATGLYDVWMEGDNFYEVYRNSFAAAFGSVSLNGGNNSVNSIFQNEFDGNLVGLYSTEDLGGIKFYQNCLNTYFADTYLDGATISPPAFLEPANNCFTHLGNSSSSTYDITGNPDPFTYFEPADNVIDCKDAVKAHPNVSITESGPAVDACAIAGSDLVTPPEEEEKLCSPQRTIAATQEAISFLNAEIGLLPPNDEQRKDYERCLKRAKRQLFELYIIDENYSSARSLFSGEEADKAAAVIFSSYIFEGDLEAAEEFLTTINPAEEPLADFIKVQLLNLDRLSEGPNFQATVSELDSLEFIAHKEHRYAGYAKSLHYALTGDILAEDLPLSNHSALKLELEGRATHATRENELSIFPNPFSEQLQINVGTYSDAQLNITDVLGRRVHTSWIQESNFSIPTADWAEGLYIVTVSRNDEILHRRKVMLAK